MLGICQTPSEHFIIVIPNAVRNLKKISPCGRNDGKTQSSCHSERSEESLKEFCKGFLPAAEMTEKRSLPVIPNAVRNL
jgi:hypothetical protein